MSAEPVRCGFCLKPTEDVRVFVRCEQRDYIRGEPMDFFVVGAAVYCSIACAVARMQRVQEMQDTPGAKNE